MFESKLTVWFLRYCPTADPLAADLRLYPSNTLHYEFNREDQPNNGEVNLEEIQLQLRILVSTVVSCFVHSESC